ncbi:MAG TPA: DUF6644 family protein [Gammaproteobacteria bacterium]
MDAVYDWITSTPISGFVLGYAWAWPTLESLHFIGLCFLIGALLIMDLRLIGFQRVIPLRAVHSLMPVAIVAFAVNLVTGVLFVFGDPHLYFVNPAFQLKMLFVLLAGLNFLLYYVKVEPKLATLGPNDATPPLAKAVGVASLAFWFLVLSYGRLLPYLGTGGG